MVDWQTYETYGTLHWCPRGRVANDGKRFEFTETLGVFGDDDVSNGRRSEGGGVPCPTVQVAGR